MSAFWFVAGLLVGAAITAGVFKLTLRAWWQWLGVLVFLAWCVFGTAVAAATFAEGYPKGGFILLLGTVVVAIGLLAGLRALIRGRTGKTPAPALKGA